MDVGQVPPGDAGNLVKKSHRGPESKVAATSDCPGKGMKSQVCPQPKPLCPHPMSLQLCS